LLVLIPEVLEDWTDMFGKVPVGTILISACWIYCQVMAILTFWAIRRYPWAQLIRTVSAPIGLGCALALLLGLGLGWGYGLVVAWAIMIALWDRPTASGVALALLGVIMAAVATIYSLFFIGTGWQMPAWVTWMSLPTAPLASYAWATRQRDHSRWLAAILLALLGLANVLMWVSYRHVLIGVSYRQLGLAWMMWPYALGIEVWLMTWLHGQIICLAALIAPAPSVLDGSGPTPRPGGMQTGACDEMSKCCPLGGDPGIPC
jgi:F0F1-type ATP synthase membrane subunit c/vacuolar-type H+-ATPase subunit K